MESDNEIEILITKFYSGEALPEESMKLEDWVHLSLDNESYFTDCSKIFAMNIDITYNDRNRVWKNISNVINKESRKSNIKIINRRWISVAASVLLIVTIGLLINSYFNKTDTVVYNAKTTSRGVLLKDKSKIILFANSSITIDKGYGTKNRRIKLNGSASFSVVHNPLKKFIVDMDMLHIKDVGTAFSVITSPTGDTIVINVTEGEVSVYDDFGSSINVKGGKKVIYIKSLKKLQLVHIKQDSTRATDKKNIEIKNTDSDKNKNSNETQVDSSVKNYPYSSYPAPYPLNEGYTPEGKRALMYKDSVETNKITADMLKDKLISNAQPLSFRLSNTEFIINGKLQSNTIFQRYREKYIPVSKQNENWDWSHNMNEQGANHK